MFYCWLILNLSLSADHRMCQVMEKNCRWWYCLLCGCWIKNAAIKIVTRVADRDCLDLRSSPHLYISMGDGRLSLQAWDFSMEMYEAAGSWVKHQQTLWGSYHILIEKIIQWAVLVVMAYQPARRKDCTTTKFLPGIMPDSSLSKDMILTVTVLRRAWINKTII